MRPANRIIDGAMGIVLIAIELFSGGSAHARQQLPAEPPKVIRKSGAVLQASATRRVEPDYPPLAKAAHVTGAVVVELTIDESGKVISAKALSGHPLLKDAQ